MFTLNPTSVNSGPMGTGDLPLHVWLQERNEICGDWWTHVSCMLCFICFALEVCIEKIPLGEITVEHVRCIHRWDFAGLHSENKKLKICPKLKKAVKEQLSLLDLVMFICSCSICNLTNAPNYSTGVLRLDCSGEQRDPVEPVLLFIWPSDSDEDWDW